MELAPTQLLGMQHVLRDGAYFAVAHMDLHPRVPLYAPSHDAYELVLLQDGAAQQDVAGQTIRRRAGDLVFLRPSDPSRFRADPDCRLLSVIFRSETAAYLASRYPDDCVPRFFWSDAPVPDAVHLSAPKMERAVNIWRELATAQQSRARIEHFLLSILLHVVPLSAQHRQSAPRWLLDACAAAERPEVFSQGVPGFVALAGRGHAHVCRQMTQHLGMSPTAFITKLRMQHAAKLLRDEMHTIEAVAEACGLSNLSHFYKVFQAHYGSTPRAYRMRHRRDAQSQITRDQI